jgi:hypothetical protein
MRELVTIVRMAEKVPESVHLAANAATGIDCVHYIDIDVAQPELFNSRYHECSQHFFEILTGTGSQQQFVQNFGEIC